MASGPRSPRDCRLMRERSLPELTGMGTWLMPKGVGCCRPWPWRRMGRARICCRGWACGSLSESVSIRKTRGCRRCLDEEVIHGAGILHAVQGLDVRGVRGPRGVAVRAAARLGAPAEHVRGSVDSSLDRPSRADHGRRGPRGYQSPCRCARSAG